MRRFCMFCNRVTFQLIMSLCFMPSGQPCRSWQCSRCRRVGQG